MSPRSGAQGLRFLFEVSRRLNRARDLDPLLQEVRELCLKAVDAEACSLLLWNDDRTRLEFQMAYNRIDPDAREMGLAPGEGLAGWISRYRAPSVSNDAANDPRFRHGIDRRIGFRSRNLVGVPLFRGNEVMGVVELHNKRGDGGFTADDVRLLEALADQIAVALENVLIFRRLRREIAENEALYRISLLLNERLGLDDILETFLDQVRSVVPYQAGAFYLLDSETDDLEWFAHRGYPDATVAQARLKLGQGAVGWAAKAAQPLVIPDVSKDPRYLNARPETRAEVVVPIVSESRVIGIFNLESDRIDAFRSADLRILQAFANQAAISIQRAQFYRELREKSSLEDEMRFARQIQTLFLPEDDIPVPGYDLAGLNLPSRTMSGDFYDYIRIASGQIGLVIGDVSGKGAPAALIMATLRASLRAEVRNHYSITEILAKVNYLLWESTRPEQFATAVYGVLDEARRVFTYVNAGHNPPLLLRRSGKPEWLAEGGVVLGPFPASAYREGKASFDPGDLLVLYTDGVTEARAAGGEEFGSERLVETVRVWREASARDICRRIVDAVRQHAPAGASADDLTLVVLKAEAGAPASGSDPP